MTTSGTQSPSSLIATSSIDHNTKQINISSNRHFQEQNNDSLNNNHDNLNLLRRSRAETMPTSFPYNISTHQNSEDNRINLHHWNHDSTNTLLIQSPTTPTTDQLLKGDANNTIASTFASLGLDEHHISLKKLSENMIHTSHSYSSLHTLSENQQKDDWYDDNNNKTNESLAYFSSNKGEDLRSSVAQLRLSHHMNRPRAMSAIDPQFFMKRHQQEDTSPLLMSHNPSIWHSSEFVSRPFLRSSSSSADLIEMMARQQRKPNVSLTSSPNSGIHPILNEEDSGWTGDSFKGESPSSSSYERQMNNIDIIENIDTTTSLLQTPTRSLWLGQLYDITSQTSIELNALFSQFGVVESIRLLPDRDCAFINFVTVEDAIRAKDIVINKLFCRLFSHSNYPVKVGFGKLTSETPQQQHIFQSPIATYDTTQGPTRALWVGNIPINTTQASLGSIFASFGMIESIRVLSHKNCGFINFIHQEDAIRAKKSLHNKEIMGPGTGLVKIGFAKVPPSPTITPATHKSTLLSSKNNNVADDLQHSTTSVDVVQQQQQQQMENYFHSWSSSMTMEDQQQQQWMVYMMEQMMGNNSNSVITAIVAERKLIMQEFGEDDSDGPTFDALHLPQKYYHSIPAAPELGQSRKVDISRLRDIRKRLDTGSITVKELEVIALECLDEIVELCSDYIGNTIIQRLFEKCSETTKSLMLEQVAPYLASIGVHKNGTWAAQKIIETTRLLLLPSQTTLLCNHIKPYVPALLLDQFGNYVVQCCLGLGPHRNQFIFDAIVDSCWEIAQGRFGARAVRATLESPHVTKRQQKYIAAAFVQHALLLATNANGALLLIWFLDTSGIPGRYRVLAPRLLPHLNKLCIHKLASLTILKLINQRQEPEARALILDALFFSASSQQEVPSLIDDVLHDQVHGVNLIQKILSSSYIELRERQRIAERVKYYLTKLKLQHIQGYKRLVEEINMVMVDSAPGASLGVPTQFSISPSLAAALHAKYMLQNEDMNDGEDKTTATMVANFYAAAAAAAAATIASNSSTLKQSNNDSHEEKTQ
ncbi:armadillo-type protein [Cokeromyces recurvatus]|uniref:armadillo-type protein n=1 Tax=Cokeromyces recurvatus TaxID=90255 RepID=UPI00221F9D83|nr:armadillo-type protein [Cokeromyces recurvatus]KAI7905310.1 armadillo-type protein [Cokeromyces recurvatus]